MRAGSFSIPRKEVQLDSVSHWVMAIDKGFGAGVTHYPIDSLPDYLEGKNLKAERPAGRIVQFSSRETTRPWVRKGQRETCPYKLRNMKDLAKEEATGTGHKVNKCSKGETSTPGSRESRGAMTRKRLWVHVNLFLRHWEPLIPPIQKSQWPEMWILLSPVVHSTNIYLALPMC